MLKNGTKPSRNPLLVAMAAVALTLLLTPLAASGANNDPILVGGDYLGSATTVLRNNDTNATVFQAFGLGTALWGSSDAGQGVFGYSATNIGVVGQSTSGKGVLGEANGSGQNAIGVQGTAHNDGIGVNAWSDSGTGLYAGTNSGTAAFGVSDGGPGGIFVTWAANSTALSGHAMSTGANSSGVGVSAESDNGTALWAHAPNGAAINAQGNVSNQGAIFAGNQAAKTADNMPFGIWGMADNGTGLRGDGRYGGVLARSVEGFGVQAESETGTAIMANAAHGQAILANANIPNQGAIFAGNQAAKTADNMPIGIWGMANDGTGLRGDGKYTGILGRSSTDSGTGVGVEGFSSNGVGVRASAGSASGTALFANGQVSFTSAGMGFIPAGQTSQRITPGEHQPLMPGDMILVTLMGNPNGSTKKNASPVWFSHVLPDYANHSFNVVLTGPAGSATPFAYFVISDQP